MSLEWISVRSMTYLVTDLSIITKGNNNRMLLSWNYSKGGLLHGITGNARQNITLNLYLLCQIWCYNFHLFFYEYFFSTLYFLH